MSKTNESIVILDACVLYPAPVRDILLSLAAMGLFQPKWTSEINEEWVRNLLKKRPDLRREQLVLTVKAMNNAFRQAQVIEYESLIDCLKLPDENDRHVLASAIKAEANLIVTFNLKDFPSEILKRHKLLAESPDKFIAMLFEKNKEIVCKGIKKMISRLQNPPKTKEDVIQTLVKCRLTKTAELIKNNC